MILRVTFYLLLGLWILSELVLHRTHRAAPTSERRDAGSRAVITVLVWTSVLLAIAVEHSHTGWIRLLEPGVRVAGLAFIALGLAIRWSAILTLRHLFTVDVAIAVDHHLVRRGPYRWVRHPSYTGALLSLAGVGLAMGNWLATSILVVGPGLALGYRMRIEERALRAAFPNDYPAYARSTRRLIPGVF